MNTEEIKCLLAISFRMDNFTSREFNVNKGDTIYMFSDGYVDQFGGKEGKKMKYKEFKELLKKHTHL